jgi:acyl-CoA synthetase (AMP-forming)/AMP-acid ligase II
VAFDHTHTEYSYKNIQLFSNQLANALAKRGVTATGKFPGRVAILLPQCVETAVSHIAVFKLGGITIPLFTLFGQDALSLGFSPLRVGRLRRWLKSPQRRAGLMVFKLAPKALEKPDGQTLSRHMRLQLPLLLE